MTTSPTSPTPTAIPLVPTSPVSPTAATVVTSPTRESFKSEAEIAGNDPEAQPDHGPQQLQPNDPPLVSLPEQMLKTSAWDNRRCIMFCGILYLSSFFTGFELGISNALLALPAFVEQFGITQPSGAKEISSSFQQGLFAFWDLGSLLALGSTWYLYGWFGRVRVFQFGLFIFLCAIITETWAKEAGPFLFGRVLMGIGDGFTRSAMYLWVGESAVAHFRNATAYLFGVKVSAGVLLAFIVVRALGTGTEPRNYQIPILIGIAPQAVSILLASVLPESPRWLVQHNRIEDARKSLYRLRGPSWPVEMVEAELTSIIAAMEAERSLKQGQGLKDNLTKPFRGVNLRRTLLCIFVGGAFFVLSGDDFAATTSSYLFHGLGAADPFKYLIIIKSANFITSVLTIYIADRMSRRHILLIACGLSSLAMMGIGTVCALPSPGKHLTLLTHCIALSTMSYYGGIYVTVGTMNVELSSQELRAWSTSAGSGVAVLLALLSDVIQPKFVNATALDWGGRVSRPD